MTKELQDLAWSVLPKEFKEEVKRVANIYNRHTPWMIGSERALAKRFLNEFIKLFGHDNLTSDAEGEELLTVSRKRVQEIYSYNEEILSQDPAHSGAILLKKKLTDLFGAKCLPDEKIDPERMVNIIKESIEHPMPDKLLLDGIAEPKPSEPKYHKGEKVRYNGYVYEVEGLVGKNRYALKGLNFDLDEDMIDPYEPYTEPEKGSRNLSQNIVDCDKQLDNILKDSFREHNRLQIAAMAMQGILSCEYALKTTIQTGIETMKGDGITYRAVAEASFLFADALIAESEKGGKDA